MDLMQLFLLDQLHMGRITINGIDYHRDHLQSTVETAMGGYGGGGGKSSYQSMARRMHIVVQTMLLMGRCDDRLCNSAANSDDRVGWRN